MKRNLRLNSATLLIISFFYFNCNSVHDEKDKSINNKLIGQVIKPMSHAVKPYYLIDSAIFKEALKKPFKIYVTGNYYCHSCRENFLRWNEHYNDFKKYKNVAVLFYLHMSSFDFEKENFKTKVKFPIILDYQNRFHIVNKIGRSSKKSVFLTDKNNKIIAVGLPFDYETKATYIKLITEK